MPNVYNKRHTYPADAIYVGRPTVWGNPFRVGRDGTREEVIAKFESLAHQHLVSKPDWLAPLRGKDLLCWCFPEACHADVLLKLANQNIRSFVIRSNRLSMNGFRIVLCKGNLLADGTIYLTWTGNKVINARTSQRDRVQLQDKYDAMDALLSELATENVRGIYWQDTREYQYINRE